MIDHVQVYKPLNGQSYATAPTPRNSDNSINLSDNSNKIATTEWINSKKFIQTINTKEPDSNGNVNIPSRSVGDEWFSYTGKIPVGGVPYCGQIVTREAYSDLWNYVQTNNLVKTESEWQELNTSQKGNVPFYSDGDGSTTFRMPKIIGYIKGSSRIDSAGSYIKEGLPNITGKATYINSDGVDDVTYPDIGAFSWLDKSYPKRVTSKDSVTGKRDLIFDASLSNPIYGNSSHVTPETITILFGVYAYGEVTVTGSTTTDALASSVASVEAELANTTTRLENIESEIAISNPVGSVIAYSANSAPSGYLICNGAAVSRITYANLYTKIGDTYGAGNGSTTFNLPNLIDDRFIQGSGTAGIVKKVGLPNIWGSVDSVVCSYFPTVDGVIGWNSYNVHDLSPGSIGATEHSMKLSINASQFNWIYGNSDTVQPPALTMRYYIKY